MSKFLTQMFLMLMMILIGYHSDAQKKSPVKEKTYTVQQAYKMDAENDTIMGVYTITPSRIVVSDHALIMKYYDNRSYPLIIKTQPQKTVFSIEDGQCYKTTFYIGEKDTPPTDYSLIEILHYVDKSPLYVINIREDTDETDGVNTYISYIVK